MIDLRPTETPLGVPVVYTFEIQDRAYALDLYGLLYRILTHDDDPEYWGWIEVRYL